MKSKNSKKQPIIVEGEFNGTKVKLESGEVAFLANSAVLATIGETTALATVVSEKSSETPEYFPLKVDYVERFYAGGTIGGSRFIRREGRPTDTAVVNARIIDHAIRPLFPKDFWDDTHIVVTILSVDKENDPALAGFLAASSALSTAGIPFAGPIVMVKIKKQGANYIVGFGEDSELDEESLLVSYLDNGSKVQSIEGHAHIIPEEEILQSVKKGARESKKLFELINDFINKSNVTIRDYDACWINRDAIAEIEPKAMPIIEKLHKEGVSYKSYEWKETLEKFAGDLFSELGERYSIKQILQLISEVQKIWVRNLVLKEGTRIDGRKFDEIRPLSAEVSVLPRVHGSALFSRGLTQALTISTLASPSQKQLIQGMVGEESKRYMHHYNFPPYSTGETGRVGGFNRREIGHGLLAEKAIVPVLPAEKDFVYAIRNVTEIVTSNGSTSMASTCGSSLALMDAGVPIKAHVAGIGVGLMVDLDKEHPGIEDFTILTDIAGYEDFAGYMDFKMTGTRTGVTAIQMELKLKGIPTELLGKILKESKKARMKVLDVMDAAIAKPRKEISKYAPKVEVIEIPKDQIGQVIGSGGTVIKWIMEEMGVEIDIEEKGDVGLVSISSTSTEDVRRAKEYIRDLLAEVEVGKSYEGEVKRVEDYGVFVEILPKKEGLLHVSEYSYGFTDDIKNKVKVGDRIKVVVTDAENGRISLSRKPFLEKPDGYIEPRRKKPFTRGGDGFNRTNQRGKPRNNKMSGRRRRYN